MAVDLVRSQGFNTVLRAMFAATGMLAMSQSASAQEVPLQPGEGYVTRFSGTVAAGGRPVINPNGAVGGIIDIRAPNRPPQGQHWVDAPKRNLVTAGQVGQVFGVVLDGANPPNVYLSATSAFGLHRSANNAQWMTGMWGQGGSPGTIYRLIAGAGSTAQPFAQVTLNGRQNTGPGLGNLAYDRYNRQLFVSDLETGMIHRIALADGSDLGYFDHGVQGRANFLDVEMGAPKNLVPISFNPNSSANISSCTGPFDQTPECWNIAYSGRRVWGLGVHRNPVLNEVRLYYATWHSPAFGHAGWNGAPEDDKRNAVWSVRLGPDGNFAGDVRREFIVPDFFFNPQDIARAGYSQPVSDISFSLCGPRPIMLIAERGGIRNLGLASENPFAVPHEARTLRYELDDKGAWHAVGRYDVGFYSRTKEGAPYLHANCSGGAAFGPGYDANGRADMSKPDQFVWMTGNSLCSPESPCMLPGQAAPAGGNEPMPVGAESPLDYSQVHGIQGTAENAFEEVHPATEKTPPAQEASADTAVARSYLVDTDLVIGPQGQIIEAELTRNDASKIGDVAVYLTCEAPASYAGYFLVPGGQPEIGYHYTYGSHSRYWSHNRFGSHHQYWSHNRYQSHTRWHSHWRYASHDLRMSHRRTGSHDQRRSHWRQASHNLRISHVRSASHNQVRSHSQRGSHSTVQSKVNQHKPPGSHNLRQSSVKQHQPAGSHNKVQSSVKQHQPAGSHNKVQSSVKQHQPALSHNRVRSTAQQHKPPGSHNRAQSAGPNVKQLPKHIQKHAPAGSHNRAISQSKAGPNQPQGIGGPQINRQIVR